MLNGKRNQFYVYSLRYGTFLVDNIRPNAGAYFNNEIVNLMER
ncbi:hypothetical protein ABOONEI_2292 [Aciduliprofundum boonei T469]|nr:hypothetical protein ABOONEI_2292 [Aciduliprofundum boonei T469]